ncbi:MAG TPA: hypothetical protein PLS84_00285 [Salinivirgaceae bacterium]|nr:hypothetical protein [Salinivirgaceae bacterium]
MLIRQLKQKILVLDGAMGTMIQQLNLVEEEFRGASFIYHSQDTKGNNDTLNITYTNWTACHKLPININSDVYDENKSKSAQIESIRLGKIQVE